MTFDPRREPMRALRDLIVACESSDDFGLGAEATVLERAQSAFAMLRAIHGDTRPAEDVEAGPMIEPATASSIAARIDALQLAADALRAIQRQSMFDPQRPIRLTNPLAISDVLDRINSALAGPFLKASS